MSKPTMQDIANAMSVSRITVWKALNNRPGVSEKMRRAILLACENMGYTNHNYDKSESDNKTPDERTVAIVVSRPESSSFWMQIIHQVAKELSTHNINLMYTYVPGTIQNGYTAPSVLSNGSVSGIIVLNVYSPKLLAQLSQIDLPKVFLDTVPSVPFDSLHGDLVLLEGRYNMFQITQRLLAMDRTNLGFIGDIEYAQTNMDRYMGFVDAHAAQDLTVNEQNCMTGRFGLRTHYEEISQFIDNLKAMPDGFVCASDYIAHYVERCLAKKGISVPDQVVLTGFDNNVEYSNVAKRITTVDVQTSTLGKRLASNIIFRINDPQASCSLSYISSEIIYRAPLEG